MAHSDAASDNAKEPIASQFAEREGVVSDTLKRVFIYGINYAPELTGVGRYTGAIGRYLADRGVAVDVVTAPPHYPGWAPRDGFCNRYSVERQSSQRITRCPLILRKKMLGIWRLIAPLSFAATSAPLALWRILTTRPQAVLCVEPTLASAPLALLAAKLVGARTFLHVQGGLVETFGIRRGTPDACRLRSRRDDFVQDARSTRKQRRRGPKALSHS
jgi:colanic acid biosynthesis glycosyl transferase WcaI